MGIGDWGLGIGDWGLGVGAKHPNPKPQILIYLFLLKIILKKKINK